MQCCMHAQILSHAWLAQEANNYYSDSSLSKSIYHNLSHQVTSELTPADPVDNEMT